MPGSLARRERFTRFVTKNGIRGTDRDRQRVPEVGRPNLFGLMHRFGGTLEDQGAEVQDVYVFTDRTDQGHVVLDQEDPPPALTNDRLEDTSELLGLMSIEPR